MARPAREAIEATELFAELFHEHKRSLMGLAKEQGLTPQQFSALWLLVPGQGTAMSTLADALMCDASNVTGIADKLEARGLAQRGQAEDRRVKVLTLTPQGEALRVEMRRRLLDPPLWMLKLPREEQALLRDILRRAVDSLRTPDGE
jgi:DNA-binding MarR family transcriptional regulator